MPWDVHGRYIKPRRRHNSGKHSRVVFDYAGKSGDGDQIFRREGFAQTVAVCAINLLIFGVFLRFGARNRVTTILLASLLALTGVMLFSGFVRLGLYIDAFGMTWLRLLSAWFHHLHSQTSRRKQNRPIKSATVLGTSYAVRGRGQDRNTEIGHAHGIWRDKENPPCRPVLGRHGDDGLLTVGMVKLLCSLLVFSAGSVTSLYLYGN